VSAVFTLRAGASRTILSWKLLSSGKSVIHLATESAGKARSTARARTLGICHCQEPALVPALERVRHPWPHPLILAGCDLRAKLEDQAGRLRGWSRRVGTSACPGCMRSVLSSRFPHLRSISLRRATRPRPELQTVQVSDANRLRDAPRLVAQDEGRRSCARSCYNPGGKGRC
jgi:hypothetical protein